MTKKLLSTICLLVLFVSGTAYGQIKIGYMNTQEVLNNMPQRPEVEEKLNSFIETKRSELQDRIANFQEAVATYQENQSSMTEQEIQQREQELAQQEADMRQFQRNIQSQIQQRRSELLQPLYQAMDEAIAAVAQQNNFDFVLNEATTMGESVVYYSANEQLNITQEVIQQAKDASAQN